MRERRRLVSVARDDLRSRPLDAGEQRFEALDVHRLVQAVVDRLRDERMIGNLALAGEVLGARDLVGKHRGEQVVGAHALQRRRAPSCRRASAAARARCAFQRQRAANIGASSSAWIEDRRAPSSSCR